MVIVAVTSRFLIVKGNNKKDKMHFDYGKIDGYNLTVKKGVHFSDAIDINNVLIVNPTLIDKVATKKIKNKFDRLISVMQMVCEEDDTDTDDGYRIALDEAYKLKMELVNKYRKFITQEKLELMIQKIEILEEMNGFLHIKNSIYKTVSDKIYESKYKSFFLSYSTGKT